MFPTKLRWNFKTLVLLQIAAKSFQFNLSWIFIPLVHKNYFRDFWNFEFLIFNIFFFKNVKFTIGPYAEMQYLKYVENERS